MSYEMPVEVESAGSQADRALLIKGVKLYKIPGVCFGRLLQMIGKSNDTTLYTVPGNKQYLNRGTPGGSWAKRSFIIVDESSKSVAVIKQR